MSNILLRSLVLLGWDPIQYSCFPDVSTEEATSPVVDEEYPPGQSLEVLFQTHPYTRDSAFYDRDKSTSLMKLKGGSPYVIENTAKFQMSEGSPDDYSKVIIPWSSILKDGAHCPTPTADNLKCIQFWPAECAENDGWVTAAKTLGFVFVESRVGRGPEIIDSPSRGSGERHLWVDQSWSVDDQAPVFVDGKEKRGAWGEDDLVSMAAITKKKESGTTPLEYSEGRTGDRRRQHFRYIPSYDELFLNNERKLIMINYGAVLMPQRVPSSTGKGFYQLPIFHKLYDFIPQHAHLEKEDEDHTEIRKQGGQKDWRRRETVESTSLSQLTTSSERQGLWEYTLVDRDGRTQFMNEKPERGSCEKSYAYPYWPKSRVFEKELQTLSRREEIFSDRNVRFIRPPQTGHNIKSSDRGLYAEGWCVGLSGSPTHKFFFPALNDGQTLRDGESLVVRKQMRLVAQTKQRTEAGEVKPTGGHALNMFSELRFMKNRGASFWPGTLRSGRFEPSETDDQVFFTCGYFNKEAVTDCKLAVDSDCACKHVDDRTSRDKCSFTSNRPTSRPFLLVLPKFGKSGVPKELPEGADGILPRDLRR
uniref:Uncharacterized protein n=1 Tax=Chromera velia CCMP2878 TaxID=1169474 RepID=A0A0G4I5F7_9ALVE|eukprot:Cvel_11088.t1-p1 / transcript=Cvel_11088.t1 / gene=Cvel_11088 / organism=Chromera_velia_CCMP2878 / gene_product=hypothetical protein / transcript_product=hypothetical protein / location=Cvel_scaffold686:21619-27877(-) / protein_length=588 / sequence_SO=supercontig / SO=protein_coding / is_pseudo=false